MTAGTERDAGRAAMPDEQPRRDDGETLRDRFAMAALTALLTREDIETNDGGPVTADVVAQSSYEMADAMLAARSAR